MGNQGGKALKRLPAHSDFEKKVRPLFRGCGYPAGTLCPTVRHRTRDGAFIYALSADETSPALAAPRHAITALFSCRFKCPCPPRRQRHFHGNADRAYNTLHFASQSRVPNGGVAPFGNPHKKRRYVTPPRGAYRLFLLSSPPAVSVEQKSAWD